MEKRRFRSRLLSALLAALLGCTALTGCGKKDTESLSSDSPAETTASAEVTDTSAETAAATTETPATEHISPTEQITSALGSQIDVDATLNRDSDDDSQKNYKVSLSQLIEEGDIINSFTFVFYAGDGSSNIGTYKGGCGISVTQDCAAATSTGWYQSPDFSVQAQGSYVEVTWNVPSEIQAYIPATGDVQIGYWWGNTSTVNLRNVICSYTRTATIPVDGTQTISVGQTLKHGDDTTNSVRVPLADVLGTDGIPQAVTFDIRAGGALGKFTGAFGITTESWYQTGTIAVPTQASSLNLTWIIPEEIKTNIPQTAELMLGYWWGEVQEITLESVTVKYSSPSGTITVPSGTQTTEAAESQPAQTQAQQTATQAPQTQAPAAQTKAPQGGSTQTTPTATEAKKPSGGGQTVQNTSSAAEIVKAIKVGWVLGNSLDSYDATYQAKDLETYWGNVKTTKATIDTVKAKGFNAIRIPVSWGNHLDSSNTINSAWMDRVQEVVDYAIDNDMYVILNMHHDDYLWVHPVYAEESAVTSKYTRIWQQIADRFKNYDNHLLFEGLNEPRMVGSAAEWTGGTAEEHTVINHLLQKFVETVRASGGNNAKRPLIVTTHAASITDTALNGLTLPNDKNLIVSIHNYAPWQFTTLEYPNVKNFDDAGKQELEQEFDKLKTKFIDKGIPVIIGEFGAEDKDNTSARKDYYAYYIKAAKQRGIPCFIWDNGGKDSYGLLDRSNNTWYYGDIADAAVSAAAT